MGFLGKLKFWDKEPDFDSEFKRFDTGSKGESGSDFLGESKETGGFAGDQNDRLGLGRDITPGLGGTAELGRGVVGMDVERGIEINGPGYEQARPPEMRESPLTPRPLYQQPQHEAPKENASREMELILSKLDTIKLMIENINHRLEAIERAQPKKGRMEW